jgi:hypothetical protein
MNEPVAQLAFEESTRGVDLQMDGLNSIRSTAAVLLAAAGVVASFFGPEAFKDGLGGAGVIAIVALSLVDLGALILLAPGGWRVSFDASDLVRDYEDAEPASAYRDLALHRGDDFTKNERQLQRLAWLLRGVSAAFAVEVLAWIIEL